MPAPIPAMPTGTEVASYATYAEAQHGVDFLSDNGFDVSAITIVGTDLHLVERVTGRLTIARVAMSGASNGALWGALAGMIMSAGQGASSTGVWVVGGIVVGALAGMALSALAYMARGGRRDFTSSQQVVASRYAVLAASSIDEAFALLQKTPGNMTRPARPRRTERTSGPTEYGSRPDEQPRFGVRLSHNSQSQATPSVPEADGASEAQEETQAHEETPASPARSEQAGVEGDNQRD